MPRVVQLADGRTRICGWGSGTIVDPTGLILTNFHVVEFNPACPDAEIGIQVSGQPGQAPQLEYIAVAAAIDAALDLAVLRISESLDGSPVPEDLPSVELGDSDELRMGQALTILGFPALGGATITSTHGSVSGFLEDGGLQRAWIKTDTTITGGNSGGLVVNGAGQMVGVPTRASESDDGEVADCRIVQDTNGDQQIDASDQCVPIGGFLNLIRPIALATSLIDEAKDGSTVGVPTPHNDGLPQPEISILGFGTGVENGELVNEGPSLPPASDQVCALLSFADMQDGTSWSYGWSHDGNPVASDTRDDLPWVYGSELTGTICAGVANAQPVKDGLWDLAIYWAGSFDPSFSTSVFVGGHHPLATVEMVAFEEVCELFLVPQRASGWQDDVLDNVLSVGDSEEVQLPAGSYRMRALDCAGLLVDERDEVAIADDSVIWVGE